MGVIAVSDIDYGQIFGPFPALLASTDPSYVIGLLTKDQPSDSVVIKVDTNEPQTYSCVDWLPYVTSARDEEEQNMEAYPKEGGLFYRALRMIRAGEKLFVWYSKDFTQLLAIPELQTNSKRDEEQFVCTNCGESFEFPFPLRAHLKFKCSFLPKSNDNNLKDKTTTVLFPNKEQTNNSLMFTSSNNENSNDATFNPKSYFNNNNKEINISSSLFQTNNRKRLSDDEDSAISPPLKQKPFPTKPEKKANSVIYHSIEKLCQSDSVPIKERTVDDDLDNANNTVLAHEHYSFNDKRDIDRNISRNVTPVNPECRGESPTRSISSPMSMSSSLNSPPPTPHSPTKLLTKPPSPPTRYFHSAIPLSTTNSLKYGHVSVPHTNQDDPYSQQEPSTSFNIHNRKRMGKSASSSPSSSSSSSSSSSLSSAAKDIGPNSLSSPPSSSLIPMPLYMSRLPIMPHPTPLRFNPSQLLPRPPTAHPVPSIPSATSMPIPDNSPYADQIPPGLLEMCRATIPTVGPLTESFAANIRNGNLQALMGKQALFADRHISSLGFLKSSNPMVEKLLQTTNPTLLSSPTNAMNLSQNWCAKCNATFRMTSDLVYHMRSHHKREFDPMKKKREEKLRCNICNETFRERHHLTRHMSSHA